MDKTIDLYDAMMVADSGKLTKEFIDKLSPTVLETLEKYCRMRERMFREKKEKATKIEIL